MLDPKVLEQMIQDQITTLVTDQVMEVFASDDWLKPLENKIVQHTQDYFLRKFSNATAVPEIITAVKQGINDLFASGQIPHLKDFVNAETVENAVNKSVEQLLTTAVKELGTDPAWLSRVEDTVNQTVAHQTVLKLQNIDIKTIINNRVDENVDLFLEKLRKDFSSVGIEDKATTNQMTIMDSHTVFENNLTAQDLTVANYAQIQHLVVSGSVNTNNPAWDGLSSDIAEKTLQQLTTEWKDSLVQDVVTRIQEKGIDFDRVAIMGEPLVNNGRLSTGITKSSLKTLGVLDELRVGGPVNLYNTVSVVNRRLGINTEEPETALSIWDEEVNVNLGKNKLNQAYIGTGRAQGIAIGTNRQTHIDIDTDGMTQIKKLRIGVHQISHSDTVPGWSGTRGDIVFNSNPVDDVFAWVCLGNFKWKLIKSKE